MFSRLKIISALSIDLRLLRILKSFMTVGPGLEQQELKGAARS
jgi:hypothetical protein